MTSDDSLEPDPDFIIRDLHKIREKLLDEFGGDLRGFVEYARKQQESSGHPIVYANPTPLTIPPQIVTPDLPSGDAPSAT